MAVYQVHKIAALPYTPAQVFAVVEDIPAYPQFLPWCGGARILSRTEQELTAEIDVVYGSVRKSFSSRNRFRRDQAMDMRLVNGPFRVLEGLWRFDPAGSGTQITFDLQFDFSNPLVAMVMGPVFRHASESMVSAFVKRSHAIYGQSLIMDNP